MQLISSKSAMRTPLLAALPLACPELEDIEEDEAREGEGADGDGIPDDEEESRIEDGGFTVDAAFIVD